MATVNKDSKIAVLCGGLSSEREVSLRSGEKVYKSLLSSGYVNAKKIDVGRDIATVLKDGNFEYAFNVLHGKYGEDGCIQGVLEFLQIPYTGPGVKASAICLDKDTTKTLLKEGGIPIIKSCCVSNEDDLTKVFDELNFPVMVKPAREGSSIGMTKVNTKDELKDAFKIAKKTDDKILIEEFKNGESCTVGVLEKDGKIFATPILGFRTKTEWYDYEAKYTQGLTEFILPANFNDELTKKIQELSIKAFKICECSGVSRVDFLVVGDTPYCLEINTSPGMTDLSDLPAQANEMGIDYNNLVEMILNTAGLNK
ncbi:MAG: D-alanine--D-alanine ligase [Cyanobacteria bacterium SIG30]|nr:D-alanine--D-alanine ligase [Cyanobacteria bacterium SIG30]